MKQAAMMCRNRRLYGTLSAPTEAVGDRLPALMVPVLGCTEGGSLAVFARDDGGSEGWLWARQTWNFNIADPAGIEADDDYDVRFWMPLPAAPGSSTISTQPVQAQGEAVAIPAGLSRSDAEFWLRHRSQIIEACRAQGFTIVSTARGVNLMKLGEVEAQAAPAVDRGLSEVDVTDAMAMAFHRAISDGSVGTDDVEDIKTGLRAALAASAPSQFDNLKHKQNEKSD